MNFKKVRKAKGKKYECVRTWIHIGAGALMQRKKTEAYPAFPLDKTTSSIYNARHRNYGQFERIVGAKFILFRERDSHAKFNDNFFPDFGSKVETSLRMGLKGGMNLLAGDIVNSCVNKIKQQSVT